ncbi:1,4-alpha-glucan branching protein domain-containing protein [Neomoorella humiferrea]|uniref:1,4-alpha-glucan branching enzyme n=1 Tax=Neomoorella humiferrea TaxID=676965 RepID=A0A2T0AW88_9FIRM|nr:1,4-alpha-glucan branching protein domain-containing protein [Moorella humiferrea]PRR74857.1 1,4-alpha-glucan branching enzyme [Moorella humiferrea]
MALSPQAAHGYLALFLHAHLPYLPAGKRGTGLEEKWLYEALTESYLPLLLKWETLAGEGVDFSLTLSLSPTLIAMLGEKERQERYALYLEGLKELALKELERTAGDPHFQPLAEFYYQRLQEVAAAFNKYGGDLLTPLKRLRDRGHLEIVTTCATHGYLPLMLTREARYAQIKIALDFFAAHMGWTPGGFWLPECGYAPGLEKLLARAGIKYFIVAAHGMVNAVPEPPAAVYAPVKVGGVACFGRDWETSHQVWSRTEGYPGDPVYREFYRDIGYDLDFHYLAPYLIGGVRGDTGFKYYRITGRTEVKEPYDYRAARTRAAEHARDFMAKRERQVLAWAGAAGGAPIVVAPYDAELFGHWWFEGPDWLEDVLRLAAAGGTMRLTTLAAYLENHPPVQEIKMGPSSWGEGGYNRVWLNELNDWIYPPLHRAEKAMVAMASNPPPRDALGERALRQAARELLLAQSSDWPFILTNRTVVDYARRRLKTHLANFFRLYRDYREGKINEVFLSRLEARHGLFPHLDYSLYRQGHYPNHVAPVVVMLSWEYPPHHVGGLGIHVRDLAEALVKRGCPVHVLTPGPGGRRAAEVRKGVYLHYLPFSFKPETFEDFLYWVLEFNIAAAARANGLRNHLPPGGVIIHAHDWLAAWAGRELREAWGVPLVCTIHATEYGRNRGLHNDCQRTIHEIERELAAAADRIICCSRYMAAEVQSLFKQPAGKIKVIPNAVRPVQVQPVAGDRQVILYVGRLVIEKGVQVLIAAFARLLKFYPRAELIIAGRGPYEGELIALAVNLGIGGKVRFLGFVTEEERNKLLGQSTVAVFPSLYEPFGIVALEAMSAGVPVIVSRTGGLAEIVEDGVTGLAFTPGDPDDLLRCLLAVLSNPGRAQKLSRHARAKVAQDYTWDAVAEETLALYKEMMQCAPTTTS